MCSVIWILFSSSLIFLLELCYKLIGQMKLVSILLWFGNFFFMKVLRVVDLKKQNYYYLHIYYCNFQIWSPKPSTRLKLVLDNSWSSWSTVLSTTAKDTWKFLPSFKGNCPRHNTRDVCIPMPSDTNGMHLAYTAPSPLEKDYFSSHVNADTSSSHMEHEEQLHWGLGCMCIHHASISKVWSPVWRIHNT